MSRIEELENEIKVLENRKIELLKELEGEKQKKVECPFKFGDRYFLLSDNGIVVDAVWEDYKFDNDALSQGNAFEIEEEAEKESDRRVLLTRFRKFRDKCNGDWKPDFKNDNSSKYYIAFHHDDNTMTIYSYLSIEEFNLFGYFKEREDAERAIELFGNEIKRLFVEG
jgi:hypothetical protein